MKRSGTAQEARQEGAPEQNGKPPPRMGARNLRTQTQTVTGKTPVHRCARDRKCTWSIAPNRTQNTFPWYIKQLHFSHACSLTWTQLFQCTFLEWAPNLAVLEGASTGPASVVTKHRGSELLRPWGLEAAPGRGLSGSVGLACVPVLNAVAKPVPPPRVQMRLGWRINVHVPGVSGSWRSRPTSLMTHFSQCHGKRTLAPVMRPRGSRYPAKDRRRGDRRASVVCPAASS